MLLAYDLHLIQPLSFNKNLIILDTLQHLISLEDERRTASLRSGARSSTTASCLTPRQRAGTAFAEIRLFGAAAGILKVQTHDRALTLLNFGATAVAHENCPSCHRCLLGLVEIDGLPLLPGRVVSLLDVDDDLGVGRWRLSATGTAALLTAAG